MNHQKVLYDDKCLEADAEIKKMKRDGRVRTEKKLVMMAITASMLFILVSPLVSGAQHKYESAVLYHGKIAVQLSIPVITHVFGIYQFIGPGAFTFGFGSSRPVLSKEKTGSDWLDKMCGPSKSLRIHGACDAF